MRPTFKLLLNLPGYRQAKERVRKNQLGVYTQLRHNYRVERKERYDSIFFLLHRSKAALLDCCAEFSLPTWSIITSKRRRYGYYALRLSGARAKQWLTILEGKTGWFHRTWKEF